MKRLRLEFLSGPRRGDAAVFSASTVSLGRSRSNTFVLPDTVAPAASGRHAQFVHEPDGWWLVDQQSTNGTYLNGQRITRIRVESGDRVTLGDLELRVGFVEPSSGWLADHRLGLAVLAAVLVGAAGAFWVSVVRQGQPQRIAELASRSVYLVAIDRGDSRAIVGTAFAVTDDGVLATNAHVAAALDAALAEGGQNAARPVAVRTDSFDVHGVAATARHPEWRPRSIAHDVALLRLASAGPTVALPLASAAEVRSLRRGVSLASFGFPAVSTDPSRPRGRLSVDVLSDLRLPFLEVGLGIAPGTSGSPVFAADGTVVALVVSGDFVGEPGGGPARPSGTNVNWAIAVDELGPLLHHFSAR